MEIKCGQSIIKRHPTTKVFNDDFWSRRARARSLTLISCVLRALLDTYLLGKRLPPVRLIRKILPLCLTN